MIDMQDDSVERLDRGGMFAKVELQFDMQAFVQSTVGRYLVGAAERDRAAALEELATTNPDDPNQIRDLQQRVAVVDAWQGWIADAITEGKVAQQQLTSLDRA